MKPDAFAAVMATGIVSIAAADHGYHTVSGVLGVLAAAGLAVLVAVAAIRWPKEPPDVADADVTVRLFTFVAACAVLDSRYTSIPGVLWTLSVLAATAWLVFVVLLVRSFAKCRWHELRENARGAWELPSVGTSGLVLVTVALARHTGWDALLPVAVVLWVLAIAVYLVMTTLILARAFAARLDPDGFEPDAWILMGGLAIATLAGDQIHRDATGWVATAAWLVTVGTWVAATAWIPALLYFGLRHIRRPGALRFAGVWWAMVFPLGMYSVATDTTSEETGWFALSPISHVVYWIALGSWAVVAAAGLSLLGQHLRRHLPSRHGLQ
ncbi:tellurite resistance/C4-dicarboxylate transporter family protein [Mycolicibacterium pulveris]|uniref:tellurite resistance/C4-dicarboxylate transporter family protein n=1 Tax=Mycolicibacterium pulveris TaxID=36813 RepID=UPI003CF33CA9